MLVECFRGNVVILICGYRSRLDLRFQVGTAGFGFVKGIQVVGDQDGDDTVLSGLTLLGRSLLLVPYLVLVLVLVECGLDRGQPALHHTAKPVEGQSLDVVLNIPLPGRDHAGELEAVQHAERLKGDDE